MMLRPLAKPAAAVAMAANVAAERRERQLAEMMDMARATMRRVVELTDQVADLSARIAQLEGEGRG